MNVDKLKFDATRLCLAFLMFGKVLFAAQDFWDGANYALNSAPQHESALQILENLDILPTDHILDVGCGSGDISAFIATLVPLGHVQGLDLSESMVAFAKQRKRSIANLSFCQQDIQAWNGEAGSFNHVVAFNVLQWVQDLNKALNNISQSLKPNGSFVALLAHKDHFLYPFLIATALSEKWASYFNNPLQDPWYGGNEEDMHSRLCEAGLKPISVKQVSRKAHFDHWDDFINWTIAWFNSVTHMQQLPERERRFFFLDCLENYRSSVIFNLDGSFDLEYPLLVVKAVKS
ncbi:MAG TPA: class I SAM-dependent methyltransferase [Chlamydiales bacterium]|nr:class I SAM-dependent methyltransferase [Chlamydiales bacterium]